MGGEDVADAGDLALRDQRADFGEHLVQRRVEPLQLDGGRFAAPRIVDRLRLAHQHRADGDAGRGGDADHLLAGPQGGHVPAASSSCTVAAGAPPVPDDWQRLDFLAQPFSTARTNAGKASSAIEGSAMNSSTCPRCEPIASSLLRLWPTPRALAAGQAHADLAGKGLCDLGQHLAGRACRPWALASGTGRSASPPARRHPALRALCDWKSPGSAPRRAPRSAGCKGARASPGALRRGWPARTGR